MQLSRAQGLQPHLNLSTHSAHRATSTAVKTFLPFCWLPDRQVNPDSAYSHENKQSSGVLLSEAILPSISLREGDGIVVDGGASMKSKKQKLLPSKRRHISRLERQLAAVEAQIARLETDPHLGLAQKDDFFLWNRASLFGTERPPILQ